MRYMSIPTQAIYELSGNELKVYMVMVNEWSTMADELNQWYYRSIGKIMEATNLSNKTVIKCIKGLVEKGYLCVKKDKDYEHANWYQPSNELWHTHKNEVSVAQRVREELRLHRPCVKNTQPPV